MGCCALATVAVAALMGCGKKDASAAPAPVGPTVKRASAMVEPGKEDTYFPVAVGNQWSYEAETVQGVNGRNANQKSTITYKIEKVTNAANGGKYVQLATLENGKPLDKEVWLINKNGIYQYAIGQKLTRLSTPQLMVGFPVKEGAKAAWKGTVIDDVGKTRKMNTSWIVNGEEEVDSANNTYNAIKVSGTGKIDSPNMVADIADFMWLAPNVGIVRRRQELIGTVTAAEGPLKGKTAKVTLIRLLRLKNFSPKK